MQCPNCGSEDFEMVRKLPNKSYDGAKDRIVYSPNSDLRKILCKECHRVYFTQTAMLYSVEYDGKTLKSKKITIEEIKEKAGRNELF